MNGTRTRALSLLILGVLLPIVSVADRPPEEPTDFNVPPVAAAGPDRVAMVGKAVSFEGSASYDPDVTGSWEAGPPMPESRGEVAGVVLGTDLYVVGGYERASTSGPSYYFGDTFSLDTASRAWETRAPMPTPRARGAGVAVGASLRVLGGVGGPDSHLLDVAEQYDPVADEWSTVSPMPYPETVVAVALGSYVYFWDHAAEWFYRQRIAGGAWEFRASPPKLTFYPSLVTVGQEIYLVGWNNYPSPAPALFAYDARADTWRELSPPAQTRCDHGAVAFRGLLVVISGETCSGNEAWLASGEVYDPRLDTWYPMSPIPTPRDEFASGVVGDCIYTTGGSGYLHTVQYDVTEIYCARLQLDWDFGDGSRASGEAVSHAYGAAGTYTVTLTVTDPLGAQGIDTATVVVQGPAQNIETTIDFDPDTLNPRSHGRWVTVYIELPAGFDPADIDAATIRLNDALAPVLNPRHGFARDPAGYLVDHDGDGIVERMVKFDRAEVIRVLPVGTNPVLITGRLMDGTAFAGMSDPVRVLP